MKVPEKVRISVDLIKELKITDNGKPKRVSDLAIRVKTTESFLLQIIRVLGKEGLINVTRGPGGGVSPMIGNTNMLKICQALGYFSETKTNTTETALKDFLANTSV